MAKGGGASRRRFRLLPTLLLTAAILLVPTAVYAWGRSSSSFAIKKVQLSGARLVPERRALRVLRRDYLSHNLFTVTAGDVKISLKRFSYVADVGVDRDFPDTLKVRIVEYHPALYAYDGSSWFVIADNGHVITEVTPSKETSSTSSASSADQSATTGASTETSAAAGSGTSSTSSTVLDATGATSTATGKDAQRLALLAAGPDGATLVLPRLAVGGVVRAGTDTTDAGVRVALPVIAGLPAALRDSLAVVEVSTDGQVTLRFSGGPVVRWGVSRRSLAKTLALRAVLGRYASSGKTCTYVDVSIPDRVLARPVLK
jgi:cell division septal protein FtsQ